jgi:hypothetical protein
MGYVCVHYEEKYPVILTQTEREHLKSLIAAGRAPARKLTHARILLKADQSPEGPGWVDDACGGGEPADRLQGAQAVL